METDAAVPEFCDSQASRSFQQLSSQRQFEITNDRSNGVTVTGRWRKILLRLNLMLVIVVILFFLLLAVANGHGLQHESGMNELLSLRDSVSAKQRREQQDQHFQQDAFQAFDHHKTGEIYNVSSPEGVILRAVRLRSGSLRKYGIVLNEFEIVPGCQVESSPERVLLVYKNLGKSDLFSVDGYDLVGPVVGISVYDASDLKTTQPVPNLTVRATRANISVHLRLFQPTANVSPFCAYFEDNSISVAISNLTSTGFCHVSHLGFFSLAARSFPSAPAPAPASFLSPLAPSTNSPSTPRTTASHGKRSKTWKIVVGSVIGTLAVLALLSTVAFTCLKYRRHKRLAMLEYQADLGETLQKALIRNTRAPAAGGTRTQPILESEYVS